MFSLALVVCLVGVLLYFIGTRPKFADGWLADVGKWMFILGLAAVLFFAGKEILL